MTPPPTHLVIGTPCQGGQVTGLYLSSLLKLQEACLHEGIRLTFQMPGGDDLVTRARQEITARFLADPTATHLLFIDSDIGFDPAQVFRLLRFGTEIAAALYPLKKINWDKVQSLAAAGHPKVESANLTYVLEVEKPERIKDGFIQAQLTGSGFLMIQRSALLQMTEKYPDLRYRGKGEGREAEILDQWRYALFNCLIDEKSGLFLSEDYSFCRRWTGIGGTIWVDLQSRLQHVGNMVFPGDLSALLDPGNPPPTLPKKGT